MVDNGKDTRPPRYKKILSGLCLTLFVTGGETFAKDASSPPPAQCPLTLSPADLIKKLKAWGITPASIDEKLKQSKCITLRPIYAIPVCAVPATVRPICPPTPIPLKKDNQSVWQEETASGVREAEQKEEETASQPKEQDHPQAKEADLQTEAENQIQEQVQKKEGNQPPTAEKGDLEQPEAENQQKEERSLGTPEKEAQSPKQEEKQESSTERQHPLIPSARAPQLSSPQQPFTPSAILQPSRSQLTRPQLTRPLTLPQPNIQQPLRPPPIVRQPNISQPLRLPPIVQQPNISQPLRLPPIARQPNISQPLRPPPIVQQPNIQKPLRPPPIVQQPIIPPSVSGQRNSIAPTPGVIPEPLPIQRPATIAGTPTPIAAPPIAALNQKPPQLTAKPIENAPPPVISPTRALKGPLPETPVLASPPTQPQVAVVQPRIPPILRPDATAKTIEEALKRLIPTSGSFNLDKPNAPPMAIPDIPPVIKPRPYGSFPTSQPFYLPKKPPAQKPPEGYMPLATQIKKHLKERPPIHEPEEVIEEDLSIKDPKEW